MAAYRRPARSRFTLALLILTSITLLTLDFRGEGIIEVVRDGSRDVVAPVQDATDDVLAPVGRIVGGVIHYGDLEAENRRLRAENQQLRGQVLRSDSAELELEALLAQLDLGFAGDIPRVAARVVSTSPSNFELSITIDRGTSSGVAEGMPVVSGAGLVGRVIDASRQRATVALVTDRDLSVGVRFAASGDVGVARGGGFRRPLVVDFVDPASEVAKGEVVTTSGLQQSVYPAGIPVGLVRSVAVRPGELQQRITLDPVVDMDRLVFVSVLQWGQR